jgi:trigger factor
VGQLGIDQDLHFWAEIRTLTDTMPHSHNIDYKTAFSVEKIPGSRVKISGEVPVVELESERKSALVYLGKSVELDGFRKGHVPTPILEKHLGEMTIWHEMAKRVISHAYPHLIHEHNIEAIGQPEIEITKIAPGNPLSFTVTVSVVPEFELADYAQIAKEANLGRESDTISDEELETKIKDIQRQKTAYDRLQKKAVAKAQAEAGDLPTPETVEPTETEEEIKDASLPKLTDEYAMTLGQPGQFSGAEDFKTKLREHLEIEKKQNNATKHRADITDRIVDKTTIELPQLLIDSEINQMFAQMEEDLERAELKMDDYLTHIKKTRDDLKKEWSPVAEKRAKLQLVLNAIAKKEEIVPNMEMVEEQTKELLERFKDADEQRVRLYVASVLMNEEVMKWLESR